MSLPLPLPLLQLHASRASYPWLARSSWPPSRPLHHPFPQVRLCRPPLRSTVVVEADVRRTAVAARGAKSRDPVDKTRSCPIWSFLVRSICFWAIRYPRCWLDQLMPSLLLAFCDQFIYMTETLDWIHIDFCSLVIIILYVYIPVWSKHRSFVCHTTSMFLIFFLYAQSFWFLLLFAVMISFKYMSMLHI
jgi:hypothetical protein